MWGPLKSLTRISSFVLKELVEILRRPGAFLSLVLGPFLIMALFGVGYSGVRKPLDTVIVIPESSGLSRDPAYYQQLGGRPIAVRGVTVDPTEARAQLQRQEIDLIVIAPENAQQEFQEGRQAVLGVEFNEIDPILTNYAGFLAYRLQQEVNREILTRAADEGQRYAISELGAEQARQIPPEVIAQPTRAETLNVAQTPPHVISFFAPAVLALILQHMAVTLTALSLVRDRLSGAMELYRLAPVSTWEILLGKYIGFAILTAAMAAVVVGLVVLVLGVPFLSDPGFFALAAALLVLASLGLGFLISIVADSERQAVQLALLVLLASVFFSGLVLPIEEFQLPVQIAAHLLPVTSGIRLLQDSMLRGGTYASYLLLVLGGLALVLFVLTGVLLRRTMRRGVR